MRRFPLLVLAFLALLNLGRGSIHAFAPDGGAHSIAGLDLTNDRQTILSLFATLGFQQIVMGLFQLFVVLRRRDLVTIALAVQTAETILGLVNLYFYRTFPIVVPGQPFNLLILALLLAALIASMMKPREAAAN
jgi:hypothetical protein